VNLCGGLFRGADRRLLESFRSIQLRDTQIERELCAVFDQSIERRKRSTFAIGAMLGYWFDLTMKAAKAE
jgi:hypothetical protein